MNTELSTNYAETINQAHSDCMACDTDIREVVLRKVNKARECGLFLIEAKEQTGHGRWYEWVTANLRFGHEAARLYMAFAKANPNPICDLADGIYSLRDAMIACGALSAPVGHGQQNKTPHTFLDKFTMTVQRVFGLFNERKEKQGDVETWPESERQAAKDQLEPLVKLYQRLG